jgi:hypothetical protein
MVRGKTSLLKSPSAKDVFLNFPFDIEYEPLLYALVCSLACMGKTPRCAKETAETGMSRLDEKIFNLASTCAFSIHDLSRMCDRKGFPRNNMPFELGLVYAIKSASRKKYQIFILEGRVRQTQKTLSDLNGYDPKAHYNSPNLLIDIVVDWFHSVPSNYSLPTPDKVKRFYRSFIRTSLPTLRREWGKKINFKSLVRTVAALASLRAEIKGVFPKKNR